MKNVAILGSTGSIGVNTLKVIGSLADRFKVKALSSHSNIDLLAEQIRRFRPQYVNIVDPNRLKALKKRVDTRGVRFFTGPEGSEVLARQKEVDIVVIAIAGSCAIYPLLAAIDNRKHICLANKESVVIAGKIIMDRVRAKSAKLIPVDSEHSAIFQCLNSSDTAVPYRIYITGSGGSLHNVAKNRLSKVSIGQALKHPKWKMGKKITVDSATLMNKGLEMIEAQHLFGMPIDRIRLLIHPQAIVHSMVEFRDGAIIAQLGIPDMRLPIQYALTYPERVSSQLPRMDFSKIDRLDFASPDIEKYPCLALSMVAARLEGTYPAVLNASDEEAVKAFLAGRVGLVDIAKVIEKVLKKHRSISDPDLDDILQADMWAREETRRLC